MDMTIGTSIGDIGRERLLEAGRINRNPVVSAAIQATLSLDEGRFVEAQNQLLRSINYFALLGADVADEVQAQVVAVRDMLTGHRYQTCAVRSALDLVIALHVNHRPYTMGERIGRLCHAAAELSASVARADAAIAA